MMKPEQERHGPRHRLYYLGALILSFLGGAVGAEFGASSTMGWSPFHFTGIESFLDRIWFGGLSGLALGLFLVVFIRVMKKRLATKHLIACLVFSFVSSLIIVYQLWARWLYATD